MDDKKLKPFMGSSVIVYGVRYPESDPMESPHIPWKPDPTMQPPNIKPNGNLNTKLDEFKSIINKGIKENPEIRDFYKNMLIQVLMVMSEINPSNMKFIDKINWYRRLADQIMQGMFEL